ncbi:MAG: single-stranded DNA-binding protein [Candidatus Berkelbacteria bacterium]|nr:single-stranded DNA-binding protein [Candidatus Berkelbacteria bacterium]
MFSLNRATIIGHLTRDPELRTTPNGQNVSSFSVATNRRWTDATGAQQDAAEFHDIVTWGKLAEIASTILHKGDRAYVEGRLQTRNWEAQDGSRRSKTEIVAENLINLSPRKETGETIMEAAEKSGPTKKEKPKEKVKTTETETEEIDINDIPF